MKTSLLIIVLILFALVTVSCSNMKATDVINFVLPSGHYKVSHTAYGQHKRQQMDIYLPVKSTQKPPIVFIYGGAWKKGSKDDFEFVAHALTGLGHPVIIPDYRLYPEVKFPDFIDDVAEAIAYTEQHATTLIDRPLQRFILMGHSAGAHAAALLTTDSHYFQQHNIRAKQAALIALSGPYDLPLNDPEVKPIFPNAVSQQVNPLLQVHAGLPTVLLLHGEADKRVLPKHTRRFASALKKASIPVTAHFYPGVNHSLIIGSLAAPLRLLNPSYENIKQFLQTIH